MKLNKKQKRVLVSIPIVIIVVAGVFPLFDWMLGGDHDEIMKAFRGGLAAACGGVLFGVLSLDQLDSAGPVLCLNRDILHLSDYDPSEWRPNEYRGKGRALVGCNRRRGECGCTGI